MAQITPKKDVETLERSLRSRDKFLAYVSHELRTPLNGISGMIQLLNMTEMDDEQKEYVQVLKSANAKMQRLADNLLNYTGLFGEKEYRCQYKRVQLRDMFRKLLENQRTELSDKHLSVEVSISPLVDGKILIDQESLEIALEQVLDNAIRHSEEGQVLINASVDDRLGQKLQIEVIDEGNGFDVRLYELYRSSGEDPGDNLLSIEQHIGFGFQILNRICELSEVECRVESKRGFGSKITLTCDFNHEKDELEHVDLEPQDSHGRRVLIVDDDENGRVLLALLCKKLGLDVETAKNGQEAIDWVEKQHFDMIYMDILLPDINGEEVLKNIRTRFKGEELPIIAVTAYGVHSDEEHFLSIGFDGYIRKPVEFHRFEQLTKNMLQLPLYK